MKNIAIFASGSGTNAENIIRYFSSSMYARVAVVISNKSDAGVHSRAAASGIPSFTFSNANFKEATPILNKLADYNIDFIALAGFMSIVPLAIVNIYWSRIINIHPALLPKYGGKGMYGNYVHEAIVAAKETKTGITIHYVNEQYDEGTIIFQTECAVLPTDTAEDVATKVHDLEYKHYPYIIETLLK